MTAGVDRLAGWRQAMARRRARRRGVEHGDFTEAAAAQAAAQRLLDAHPDLDGIVAASDLMAAGALRRAARRGRRVPDDVALVGFDDLGVAERTDPPLTTMHNPSARWPSAPPGCCSSRSTAPTGAARCG